MTRTRHWATALISAALAAAFVVPAFAARVTDPELPRSLDADGPVTVSWTDPHAFSEIRYSRNRFEAERGDWVRGIARHLAKRAAGALGPGERLDVVITDIELAGDFEPGAGRSDGVRIVRDIYPPRIDLSYTLYDASGDVADSGERSLRDIGFLHRQAGTVGSGDPLRHEKRLVDAWVRDELARRTR
ncbi:hypothetical protein GCM10007164_18470 [Luteimonas padinae]|uniref:DUF3016 domain-containing protein n=1 Tax=Luteimonas padinae TaxID=1714359 RepID=A0ABV6SZQ8_9GAMM|nr:DUF3016 domain-containing protein [Luteimonas padinae]GHD71823.1 hypothetical protein GCM10007164_18470 [Luteimonas padinae]